MTDLLVGNAMRMDELHAAVDSSVELSEECSISERAHVPSVGGVVF